jgi:hypothetical protein
MTLSWWESFLLNAALAFLQSLPQQLKLNTAELAALNGAITFLQQLIGGTIGTKGD